MAPPAPCRVVSWPGCQAVSQARRPCRGRVLAGTAVSWPSVAHLAGRVVACLATQAAQLPSPLVTIHPIVLRYNSQLPSSFWSQYSLCIAIQCPQHSSLPQSQYTNVYFNTISPADRLPMSQYTAVYCDTNLNHQPQYNRRLAIQFTHCTPKLHYTSPIAIQFSSHSNPYLAIQFVAYKTRSQYNFFFSFCNTTHPTTHLGLQYNFSFTIQLGSSPNQSLHQFFFSFFFFISSSYGKIH